MQIPRWLGRVASPPGRSCLLLTFSALLFVALAATWLKLRQEEDGTEARWLPPEDYDVDVLAIDDFRRLSDTQNPAGSDLRAGLRAAVFAQLVPQKYRLTRDGRHYVLVNTKSNPPLLESVEAYFGMLGLLTFCGVATALWNHRLVARESHPEKPADVLDITPTE